MAKCCELTIVAWVESGMVEACISLMRAFELHGSTDDVSPFAIFNGTWWAPPLSTRPLLNSSFKRLIACRLLCGRCLVNLDHHNAAFMKLARAAATAIRFELEHPLLYAEALGMSTAFSSLSLAALVFGRESDVLSRFNSLRPQCR